MNPIKILVCILFMAPLLASGQSYQYEVYKGNKPIGFMDIKRTQSDSIEYFNVKSDVTFKILFSFNVVFSLEEKFVKGILHSGKGYNTLNGSYQKQTKVEKLQEDYNLTIDGVSSSLDEDSINYTVTRLYFQEPYNGQKTYSQTFGKWLTFEKVGDHEYKLPSPDGYNFYRYTNGVCTELDVNRDYGSVRFVMQPESLARVKVIR